MTCYHPIIAYRSKEPNENGKYPLVFSPKEGYVTGLQMQKIPCGQCAGCRLERSKQWAIRCMFEAKEYGSQNMFITLTYDNEHLPEGNTLVMKDYQDFMKRLRKRIGTKIRFFHCGEYGEKNLRPHYHACIFGYKFNDLVMYSKRKGILLYTSETLSKLWKNGICTVGEVTFESAQYVARYVLKKFTNKDKKEVERYYESVDTETGEVFDRKPEYITMSRRPGIGRAWIDKYSSDVYTTDTVVVRDKLKLRPPSYYDKVYDNINPQHFAEIKKERRKKAVKYDVPQSELDRMEKIHTKKLNRFIREPERI